MLEKYQGRVCSTAIIRRATGTHNVSNDANVDIDSNSDRNTSVMWLATSDHMAIPQVIFTDPQIALVGLTEESARGLKINMRAVYCEMDTLPELSYTQMVIMDKLRLL